MKPRSVKLLAGLAVIALFLALAPHATAQEQRLESQLTNTGIEPLASGHARYDIRGADRHYRVEVEDVFAHEFVFVLTVDPTGTTLGSLDIIIIDPALGFGGEVDLNTTDGDQVPSLGQGWYVLVFGGSESFPLLMYGDLQPRP